MSAQAEPVRAAPAWLRPFLVYQRVVDAVTDRLGRATKYLVLLVVLVGFINAVLRYIGRFTGQQLTSNRYVELQWYLYATVFLLGFAYILQHGINVRVDFWYADRSRRTQAWIDLVGHVVALVPFCVLGLRVVWGPVLTSFGARPDGSFLTLRVWEVWERSPDPGGLPRAPIKAVLLVGLVLLLLQALAEIVKLAALLGGLERYIRPVPEDDAPLPVE